ncbi:hypothetical protein BCU45_002970 [Vibrio lentus]|uniref:hypothetical protein n=1 Tax=Vibrio lentus TaxID=136468 RepID=UPI001F5361BC|nr:hypothetical protein [Vibrio lentus]
MGLTVLELEDCTRWSMIDIPMHNFVGSTALISKDGRQYHVQFDGSCTKYAVDEM